MSVSGFADRCKRCQICNRSRMTIQNCQAKTINSNRGRLPLPAYIALLRSLDFWRTYDFYKNEHKTFLFSQSILNPKYFSETDRIIAKALYISEKSVQNYRREFKDIFLQEYEYAKTLDTNALLSIRNTMLTFLGNNDFLSSAEDDQPDCLSSRVLQFFSDNAFRQVK